MKTVIMTISSETDGKTCVTECVADSRQVSALKKNGWKVKGSEEAKPVVEKKTKPASK